MANGYSSYFITNALLANKSGQLKSIDISVRVGGVLNDSERSVWELNVLDHDRVRSHFGDIIARSGPIELFLHDSDHGYEWQRFELETAARHMSSNGVILCDDSDHSYAFLDFCQQLRSQPVSLVDTRKVLGGIRVNNA